MHKLGKVGIGFGFELKKVKGHEQMTKKAIPAYAEGRGYAVSVNTLIWPHSDSQAAGELGISMELLNQALKKHNGAGMNLWIKAEEDIIKCCEYINRIYLKLEK